MKGKKIDSQFVSDFIAECVQLGLDTPDKIVARAQSSISEIDEEIKRLEARRMIRSKLLDVVESFEKPAKPSKVEEAKILSFFKIQRPEICQDICLLLKNKSQAIDDVVQLVRHPRVDTLFCVKQLLEYKIIFRSGNHLLRGEMFDTYQKFVLKDSA